MALEDIEQELTGEVPWRTCAVCHYMAERGEQWAASLRRMLANRGVAFTDLAVKLAKDPDEPNIERQALSRHASGGCSAHEYLRPQQKRGQR